MAKIATRKAARELSGTEQSQADLEALREALSVVVTEMLDLEREKQNVPARLLKRRYTLQQEIAAAERVWFEAHRAAAEQLSKDRRSDWRLLQRQRALTVVALRKTTAAIKAMRNEMLEIAGGIGLSLDVDGFDLKLLGTMLEPGASGLVANRYLALCVETGIITAKEANDD